MVGNARDTASAPDGRILPGGNKARGFWATRLIARLELGL